MNWSQKTLVLSFRSSQVSQSSWDTSPPKIPTPGADLFSYRIHRFKAGSQLCFSSTHLKLGTRDQWAKMFSGWKMAYSSWSTKLLRIRTCTIALRIQWLGMDLAKLRALRGTSSGQLLSRLNKWRSLMSISIVIILQAHGSLEEKTWCTATFSLRCVTLAKSTKLCRKPGYCLMTRESSRMKETHQKANISTGY